MVTTRTAARVAGVLWLLASTAALGADAAPELRLVFIAYENPDQLVEDVAPVISYLEQALGREVRHFAATDYAGVVEALRNETADAGFMGPLQYVMAHHQAGATPIVGEVYGGSPSYRSRIFVRTDSGIDSLAKVRGRTIAFVDPISSSGYMVPLEIFRGAGLIKQPAKAERFFKRIYFAGGDEQAIRAVYNRFVDAAGVGQYAYGLLRPEERDELVAIAESGPIPSHCVVVRRGLDPELARRLQQALLALGDGSHRELLARLYSVDGYVAVTHETYADVERLARDYGFIED